MLVKLCCFSVNVVAGILVVQNFSWLSALSIAALVGFNFIMGYGLGEADFVEYGIKHGYRVYRSQEKKHE